MNDSHLNRLSESFSVIYNSLIKKYQINWDLYIYGSQVTHSHVKPPCLYMPASLLSPSRDSYQYLMQISLAGSWRE